PDLGNDRIKSWRTTLAHSFRHSALQLTRIKLAIVVTRQTLRRRDETARHSRANLHPGLTRKIRHHPRLSEHTAMLPLVIHRPFDRRKRKLLAQKIFSVINVVC